MSKKKNKLMEAVTIRVDMTKVRMFTEKGDYENYMNGIRCGNTVHRPKKGKGSYIRQPKHRHKMWE